MKVLVCGGRTYDNYELLESILASYPITHLINGGATGADYLSTKYFIANLKQDPNNKITVYPVDWASSGKAAGPLRNKKMLDENLDIELIIAFPGGKGTQNIIKLANDKNIQVLEVTETQLN